MAIWVDCVLLDRLRCPCYGFRQLLQYYPIKKQRLLTSRRPRHSRSSSTVLIASLLECHCACTRSSSISTARAKPVFQLRWWTDCTARTCIVDLVDHLTLSADSGMLDSLICTDRNESGILMIYVALVVGNILQRKKLDR